MSEGEKSPPNDQMAMGRVDFNGENCAADELANCDDEMSNGADENPKSNGKFSNCVNENAHTVLGALLSTPINAFGPSLDSESHRINIDELIAALISQGGSIRDPIVASQQNPVDMDVDELIQMLESHHDRINSLLADAQQSS